MIPEEIYISNQKHFTPYVFYSYALPVLREKLIEYGSENPISISLDNIETVNPLVLPNLLNLGDILSNYYGQPVRLKIPWKRKLLSYLNEVHFFRIVRNAGSFVLDEDYCKDNLLELE